MFLEKEYRQDRIIIYVTLCSNEGPEVKEALRGK